MSVVVVVAHAQNRGGRFTRSRALTSVSLLTLAAAASLANARPASAQATPAQTAQAPSVEEIVVTGTRIVRDGYEAPTPLTVVGVEQIQAMSPPNIADVVNALPQFAGGNSPHQAAQGVAAANDGLNNLNLRGLGTQRTLVLLDGARVVASGINGGVDINGFPSALVSRIDVVTGGASAAYGSDAVSGVVNFVLDRKYTGLKGEISGGVSTYGDDRSYKISLTGGTGFANDRGHFLLSGELTHVDGIWGPEPWSKRSWASEGWQLINNPAYTAANGLPRLLVANHVGTSNATPGGIIVSGPLKGTYFGPGGTPTQFNYGSLVDASNMIGGDWRYTNFQNTGSLDQRFTNNGVFTRISYEISDAFELYAQASYAYTSTYGECCYQFNFGNIVIKADNPFIPAPVAAQMTALKLTTLTMGSMDQDLGIIAYASKRRLNRYVVGGNGRFDAMDSTWTWDAYFQKGVALTSYSVPVIGNLANFNQAYDAVRNPATGAIVCRSTLANPNNGCVPWNVFGVGVNSRAAYNYSTQGPDLLNQHIGQDVYAATVRGEPFSSWAGPVSLAFGAEHRKEFIRSASDPGSLAFVYFAGNYQPTNGGYNVTEGFVETVIPLAKDAAWAKTFDLNAAVRFTSYSTSGYVTTWKAGATYQPIDDIRLRATRSRDIRAANLGDAFAAGVANVNTLTDPFRNNAVTTYRSVQVGNPALTPEKADTFGAGIVYQPAWFQGFNASFDYYDIRIKDAIGTLSPQQTVDRCFQGSNQALCDRISRDSAGVITQILRNPFNYLTETARGYDIEASYRTALDNLVADWSGNLTLRALGTHVISRKTDDGIGGVLETAGQNGGGGPVKWRWNLQANYAADPFSVTVTGRYISGGTYNNAYVVCNSGCPASTTVNTTVSSNRIDSIWYADLAFNYKVMSKANGGSVDTEVFLTVQNLFNTAPPIVAAGPSLSFTAPQSNALFYDLIGREFRAGVRFKM